MMKSKYIYRLNGLELSKYTIIEIIGHKVKCIDKEGKIVNINLSTDKNKKSNIENFVSPIVALKTYEERLERRLSTIRGDIREHTEDFLKKDNFSNSLEQAKSVTVEEIEQELWNFKEDEIYQETKEVIKIERR